MEARGAAQHPASAQDSAHRGRPEPQGREASVLVRRPVSGPLLGSDTLSSAARPGNLKDPQSCHREQEAGRGIQFFCLGVKQVETKK